MKVSRVIHMKEITNISVMFGGLRKMTDAIIAIIGSNELMKKLSECAFILKHILT
jgi:hypothetical protein